MPQPRTRICRTAADEAGTAMVELALVLPILLALVFGLLDLGRAYNYWLESNHLANEGARLAAVGNWKDLTTEVPPGELRSGSSSVPVALRVSCHTTPSTGAGLGDSVTVTVDFTYRFVPILHTTLTQKAISSSATMRLEGNPPSACV